MSRRLNVLSSLSDSFTEAVNEVFPEQDSFQLDSLLPTSHFSDWDIAQEWNELPGPLTEWIQVQDGLKVDGKPISCKEELTSAYHFLHCKEDSSSHTLLGILIGVAVAYMCQVSRQRRSSVRDLIIPGTSPHDVMARRCSRCYNRVLDDAFACYSELDPKKYVVFYREDGCGHPQCTLGRADFVPMRPDQSWRRATRQALENITNTEWEDHLLRLSAEERNGLPRSVRVRCSSCRIETFDDERPRWTFESTPRYVRPRMGCKRCHKKDRYWEPVNKSIHTVDSSMISRMWKKLKRAGFDPANFPRRPELLWSNKKIATRLKELEEAKIIGEKGVDPQNNKLNARRQTEQRRRAERKLERTISTRLTIGADQKNRRS